MEDKELFTVEERKALIDKYPYLQARHIVSDKIPDDNAYDHIRGEWELPDGWMQLFLQVCEDIYEPLKMAGCLDTFRFSQIKEKYGSMRMYSFGAPEAVLSILDKYEFLSMQVCCMCGKPATATTCDWICPYCDEHSKYAVEHFCEQTKSINIQTYYTRRVFSGDNCTETTIDCTDEWNRYLARISTEVKHV